MSIKTALFTAFVALGHSQWSISLLSTYESGLEDGAEISAYHIDSAHVFVANVAESRVDVLHINSDGDINFSRFIDISSGAPNSVDISGDLLAVAVANSNPLSTGQLLLFDLEQGTEKFLTSLEVGVGPDAVHFSPDGNYLICANEGEPRRGIDVTQDPLGTISVVRILNNFDRVDQSMVTTLDFTAYDTMSLPSGVRLSGPEGLRVSQDLEPEFIAVSRDSRTAFVTLQEANSIAVVDLSVPLITDIWPIPLVDRGVIPFDASNRDNLINIKLWPNVYGMPQPDSISYAEIGGDGFLVIANEGDTKDYDDYYSDEIRVRDIEASRFDETKFDAASIHNVAALGRLTVSSAPGDLPETGIDALYHFGARSFSILSATNGSLIYDSGSDFEELTASQLPSIFNCGDDNLIFDSRSDDRGPEPESTAVAELEGKHYVFVTLERIGGVVMYNIDNPSNPQFVTYFNNRNLTALEGDLDPEGIQVIKAADSPTGDVLLIVNAAVTGQTSVYRVSKDTDAPDGCQLCSRLTCERIGLDPTLAGFPLVCGESDFIYLGGFCSGAVTWSEARQFCENGGMRLCTETELAVDETSDTSCGYDHKFVWSSTGCMSTEGYYAVVEGQRGHGRGSECRRRDNKEENYARCCADSDKLPIEACCPPASTECHEFRNECYNSCTEPTFRCQHVYDEEFNDQWSECHCVLISRGDEHGNPDDTGGQNRGYPR